MNIKLTFAIAIALILSPAMAQEAAFDVRGVPLGATQDEIMAAHPGAACSPGDGVLSETSCVVVGYGPDPKGIVMFNLAGGAVESVSASFDAARFGEIVGGLKVKYGEPVAIRHGEVVNAMGATFPSRTMEWGAITSQKLAIVERAGRIDLGAVRMNSGDGLRAFAKRRAAANSRAADSL